MQRKWQRHWKKKILQKVMPPILMGMLLLSSYNTVFANPAGGVVTAGSATINTSGSTLTVNQATNKAAINWNSFGIATGETVRFIQPSATSIALNRVVGTDASAIYGTLSANGRVFLINPNGILFAPGSQVNIGGLVASTLDISNADFLSGNYSFSKNGSAGSVVNQGTIQTADGGYVAFLGPQVKNEGVIAAQVTGLVAGDKISLDFNGDKLLGLTVDTGAVGGSVSNSGTIKADGGLVVMSAGTKDALLNTVINNSGVIQARSVNSTNGVIRLEGGAVTNSGTLDASGKAAGQIGGTVKVLGDTVTLASTSSIDVSGDAGGGTALVGGAYQGGASEYAATNTTVAAGATINANAITSGNGGQVVVWSNDTATFAGTITAKGGSISGNGGSVETSGKKTLTIKDTAKVNTLAPNGENGNWLLDPADFTVGTGATGANYLNTAALETALNLSNVTITTGSSQNIVNGASVNATYTASSGNGDITINAPFSWSANTLTLSAYRNININATLTASGTSNLVMTSGTKGTVGIDGTINYGLTASGFTGKVNFGTRSGVGLLTINNKDYTVIASLGAEGSTMGTDLQGMQNNLSGNYFLGADINASSTFSWNSFAGFSPIGNASLSFTGTFDGGGHTISGLAITRTNYIGLFGVASGATIANVGLVSASVTGQSFVGGLVGWQFGGSITSSYATGSVSGTSSVGGLVGRQVGGSSITSSYATGSVGGITDVGGLVGWQFGGSITSSYATGSVGGEAAVGGLVGMQSGSSITSSYATGSVDGSTDVGGLVGYQGDVSSITSSYATGIVTGQSFVGGLVGRQVGSSITSSYATGSVSGSHDVGGLVGMQEGSSSITSSYATGSVGGITDVGGLVGLQAGVSSITSSYATGIVTGSTSSVGGLVGRQFNSSSITSSYATGIVTGSASSVGGLVGWQVGGSSITSSYATGSVGGSAAVGGLVGAQDIGSSITSSYWDMETTGITDGTKGVGNVLNAIGVTGLTSAQMKSATYYSSWDTTSVWYLNGGQTAPLLRSFLTPLTVSATSITKVYDGTAGAVTGATYTPASGTYDAGKVGGTLAWSGNINAGTYGLTGLYTNSQQGYLISYDSGSTLTITLPSSPAGSKSNRGMLGTVLAASGFTSPGGLFGEFGLVPLTSNSFLGGGSLGSTGSVAGNGVRLVSPLLLSMTTPLPGLYLTVLGTGINLSGI